MEYIKKHKLLEEEQNVGVAVSGGADSMALLKCLCRLSKVYNIKVSAIHFEHGLRGEESLADADFVANYCNLHHIPFFLGFADVNLLAKKEGLSIQTAAKKARESYFEDLVNKGEVDVIATAHHKDDNAESVLMHLLRGCGINGLCGIHPKIGCYIRPFLCVSKKDILLYLQQNDVSYTEDKSNEDSKYTRNYLRNIIIPQIKEKVNKDVGAALNRLCETAQQDNSYLNDCANKAYTTLAYKDEERVLLEIEELQNLHPAIFSRVIRKACNALNIITDIEQSHINAVINLVNAGKTGSRVNLSNLLCAQIEYEKLIICFVGRIKNYSFCMPLDTNGITRLEDDSTFECMDVKTCDFNNTDKYTECFDKDKLPKQIFVRTRKEGDVIHPLGCIGKKKLKDYFIDKKLTRRQRDMAILLSDDANNIIWVAGSVISQNYGVDKGTANIIKIKYNRRQT